MLFLFIQVYDHIVVIFSISHSLCLIIIVSIIIAAITKSDHKGRIEHSSDITQIL